MRLERKRKIFYKIKMTVYLISRRKMQWERKRKDILQKDWRETYIHIWTISISCLSWVGTVHMDMFTFLLYTGYACMHDVTSWHSTSFLQICFKSLESFCSSASFPYFFLLVVFINKMFNNKNSTTDAQKNPQIYKLLLPIWIKKSFSLKFSPYSFEK